MKKLLFIILSVSFLAACSDGEESQDLGETVQEDTTVIDTPMVVPPTPTEMAVGRWLPDFDERSKSLEEKGLAALTDIEISLLSETHKNTFLDLNENGTFEFNHPDESLKGMGIWSISEDAAQMTHAYDGANGDLLYNINLQTDSILRLDSTDPEDEYSLILRKK